MKQAVIAVAHYLSAVIGLLMFAAASSYVSRSAIALLSITLVLCVILGLALWSRRTSWPWLIGAGVACTISAANFYLTAMQPITPLPWSYLVGATFIGGLVLSASLSPNIRNVC